MLLPLQKRGAKIKGWCVIYFSNIRNLFVQRFSRDRGVVLRYSLALFLIAVAVVTRHAITPLTGSVAAPFAFVTAAVMLSAWLVGTGPAAIAMIVGLALVHKYFLAPASSVQ